MKNNNMFKTKSLILIIFLALVIVTNAFADSRSAVVSLITDAKTYFENDQFEESAVLLERALRIKPHNPYLWHNLAGVRLTQEDWNRAANLAKKSNSLAGDDGAYKELRVRNWVLITQACEGMENNKCTAEARSRAQALLRN
jgi:predicted Zn-dependent protease